jgi:hypothetical protein
MTVDEKIIEHQKECSEINALLYLKKPSWIFAPSVIIATIIAIAGVVVAYKNAQAEIERRIIKTEFDIVEVKDDCAGVRAVIIDNQKQIIAEIRSIKKGE